MKDIILETIKRFTYGKSCLILEFDTEQIIAVAIDQALRDAGFVNWKCGICGDILEARCDRCEHK